MGADLVVTWSAFTTEAQRLARRWEGQQVAAVFGVPTGGSLVALEVAHALGVPVVAGPGHQVLVVDDLVDSGATMAAYRGEWRDALYRKPHSPEHLAPHATLHDGWIRFPWERDAGAPTDAVRRLLEFIGEDPNREGLADTPARVTRALAEMTSGYRQDPATVLATTFDVECDEMVVVRGIPFTSLCEHHLLPFVGTVDVGYVPEGRVVGLSKLARLVEVYARRLQVQERMTIQIADAIEQHLAPKGVAVVVRARHSCMAARGVGKEAEMVTSRVRGALRDSAAARAEFMALAHGRP